MLKGKIGSEQYVQLESITFSWCSYEKAVALVQQAIDGHMDSSEFAYPLNLHIETLDQHGRCHACA